MCTTGDYIGEAVIVQPCGFVLAASAATSKRKRAFDIALAISALAFLSPLLFLIALIIRLESRGPAIFRQRRGGLNGEPFVIYKFRTMRAQEDGDRVVQATENDPRVTFFGSILRQTSMDELPQFINVLKGDMSIVGPRPHALAHDDYYTQLLPQYHRRWGVRPGITGLAQVKGFRGETKDVGSMRDRVQSDIEYIDRWNFLLDLKLLIATAKVLIHKRAY